MGNVAGQILIQNIPSDEKVIYISSSEMEWHQGVYLCQFS